MSDDLSADFGLDVTGDESSDAASASDSTSDSTSDMADQIFNDTSGPSDDQPDAGAIFNDTEPDPETIFTNAAPAAESEPTGITADFSGTEFYAGEATFDSNGDGVADTAVQDHGYQVEYYVDNDGDGQADELTITDADGQLISHTQLVEGTTDTWQETPAPDVSAGDVSVSAEVGPSGYVDPSAPAQAPASAFASSDLAQAGADSAAQSSCGPDAAADAAQPDGSQVDTTAQTDTTDADSAAGPPPPPPPPPAPEAPVADSGAESMQSGSADDSVAGSDLTLTIDGQTYDVGAPTLDFSGNGIADTVAVEQDGNVEYYVDSDQDGIADQIIVLDEANGALINHEVYDPATGTWDNVTEESK